DPMKFVSFEDETGLYETVFFPREYRRFCALLDGKRAYVLKGRVERELGAITVTVGWIGPLEQGAPSKRLQDQNVFAASRRPSWADGVNQTSRNRSFRSRPCAS
ncbi:MAG: hypothetical protein PVG49_08965, partial [Desulfobacteraceae bacterium]